MHKLNLLLPLTLVASLVVAQEPADTRPALPVGVAESGPTTELTYRLLWLIESDDQNRKPYSGAARNGLQKAGYDRMVVAGAVASMTSVGQSSVVVGAGSRYGVLRAKTSFLNTTQRRQLQTKLSVECSSKSPVTFETTARVPLNRWFLVGAATSQAGAPLHEADGKRSVIIMRVDDGVTVLE